MKRTLIAILLLMVWPCCLWAKRLPPPIILPVDDGVYRFVSFNDFIDPDKPTYQGGHVVCYLKATGAKVWEKHLYSARVHPIMEEDVQHVYIKKMYLDEPDRLVLQNEKNKWFVLERSTGKALRFVKFQKKEDDRAVYYTSGDRIRPIIQDGYFVEAEEGENNALKIRVCDLATGRMLWEKMIALSKKGIIGINGNKVSPFLFLRKNELRIDFGGIFSETFDVKTGKGLYSVKI
jgi:hypothetical protein